jgi:phosphoglycolate phosphatase
MKFENVQGIIWDLDGTLLDSFGVLEQIVSEMAIERDLDVPTHEDFLNNYHSSIEDTLKKVLGIKSEEELSQAMTVFLKKQMFHYEGDVNGHLFSDATSLAQRAAKRGVQQLIVTNRGHEGRGIASPRAIVAATVLADFIHEVNAGDEVEYRKPDYRSTGGWLEKHDLDAKEVIVVGDQVVDAKLALNIGARAVLIKRNVEIPFLEQLSEKEHESIFIVESLDKIELV